MLDEAFYEVLSLVWYVGLAGGARFLLEAVFVSRFTGARPRPWMLPAYLVVNYAASMLFVLLYTPPLASLAVHAVLLYLYAVFLLKLAPAQAVAPCAIVFTLATLEEGFEALASRLAVSAIRQPVAGVLVLLGISAAFLVLFGLALHLVARRFPLPAGASAAGSFYILLVPCALMVWAVRASLGLNSNRVVIDTDGQVLEPQVLPPLTALIWLVACLVIFWVLLLAFRRVTLQMQREGAQRALAAQVKAQHSYLQEARLRNHRLSAYQHDIDNHLLVLDGLLKEGHSEEAGEYLSQLKDLARDIVAPVRTGNAALDVLLGEKLDYARREGAQTEWEVHIPAENAPDDIDLCILFANGLDNAIHASRRLPEDKRYLRLRAGRRQSFLLIEMENSTLRDSGDIVYGTGLANMQGVAEKYHGTLHTTLEGGVFRLSILLSLPVMATHDAM